MADRPESRVELEGALLAAYPELEAVRDAADDPVYAVGGAVRDLLLGRPRADLDLVVEGDVEVLAGRLGGALASHARFATAKLRLGGHEVDLAAAREESYPRPGALPVVRPAPLARDLVRRDFTINAMAIPLAEPGLLIDPHGGRGDLEAGLLRVLHPASFRDDPTRALRAARYAARLNLALGPETEAWLRATDAGTVSADRWRAELLRLGAETRAVPALALALEWGLVAPRPELDAAAAVGLAARVEELLAVAPWHGFAPRAESLLAAVGGLPGAESELAASRPERPSRAVELAAGHGPVTLVLARAMGAEWLDRYLLEWRHVALEIDGSDLLAAGVVAGPALGRGLREALRARLDGEARGRERELAVALAAARGRPS